MTFTAVVKLFTLSSLGIFLSWRLSKGCCSCWFSRRRRIRSFFSWSAFCCSINLWNWRAETGTEWDPPIPSPAVDVLWLQAGVSGVAHVVGGVSEFLGLGEPLDGAAFVNLGLHDLAGWFIAHERVGANSLILVTGEKARKLVEKLHDQSTTNVSYKPAKVSYKPAKVARQVSYKPTKVAHSWPQACL